VNRGPSFRTAGEPVDPGVQLLPIRERNPMRFPLEQRDDALAGPAALIPIQSRKQCWVPYEKNVPLDPRPRSRVRHRARKMAEPVKPAGKPRIADEARPRRKQGGERAAAAARQRPINEKVLRGGSRHVLLTATIFEMLHFRDSKGNES
jgi:hypothetical protein